MTVPVLVGVNVTLQLEVVALTDASVQGDPVKLPVAVPPLVNVTVPRGAEAVPDAKLSSTNVEHVACGTTTAVAGHDDTTVVVRSGVSRIVIQAIGPLAPSAVSVD